MNELKITVDSGSINKLLTRGKICNQDIIVEALPPKLEPLNATENKTYMPQEGYQGFSTVVVDVPTTPGETPTGTLTIVEQKDGINVRKYEYVNVRIPVYKGASENA